MTRSVLCAVDISNGDVDSPVLKQACQLADLNSAQLDVIAVLPDYGEGWVSSFFEEHHHEKAEAEAMKELQALCVEVLGKERNAKVRHLIATGTVYQEILNTAEKAGSDLIVVGAHKPDFKDYLMGPNAARVARHADCSVYIVR